MDELGDLFRGYVKPRPRPAYLHRKWVRCSSCGLKQQTELLGKKGFRLRDQRSPCCRARMRLLNYGGKRTPSDLRKPAG